MAQVNLKHLQLASQILVSRLCRPNTIDVAIIDRESIGSRSKIDNINNRYIGCFDIREDDTICFYLAGRKHPDGAITHLFIYYVNSNYKVVQDVEVEILKTFLPGIVDPSLVKTGVIDIKCSSDLSVHLSTLVEVIDFTVGKQMIDKYVPLQVVNTDTRSLVIGVRPEETLPYCDGSLDDKIVADIKVLAQHFDIAYYMFSKSSNIDESSVGLMLVDGHYIGIIYSREFKRVNYLLMHKNQFLNEQQYVKVMNKTRDCIRSHIDDFHCTRFYPNRFMKCDNQLIVVALDLMLSLRPNALTVIHENELLYLTNNFEFRRNNLTTKLADFKRVYPKRRSSRDYFDASEVFASLMTELVFDPDANHPIALARDSTGSQSTIVLEDTVIKAELSLWKEVSAERRRIKDSIIPPIHPIEAFNDLCRQYLVMLPSYESALDYLGRIWSKFAQTKVYSKVVCKPDRTEFDKEARFLIFPYETANCDEALIIADQLKRKWIFMKPNNEEYKDQPYFNGLVCDYLFTLFPELKDYEKAAIPISGSFHKAYPKLHLLMSVYTISRLFNYSINLPIKVIYGESELRKYASYICAELQFVNSEYNLKHGLFVNGYLTEKAMLSHPSPLQVEVGVVPKDQCMFCKRRGFKNLGRHLSMQHGGQAMVANNSRLQSD